MLPAACRETTGLDAGSVDVTAAADGLVDAVHLYVAPTTVGSEGVGWLEPGELRIAALTDRRVVPCGPDVFMEGYVHRID